MNVTIGPFELTGPVKERAAATARAIGERLLEEMQRAVRHDANYERYPNKNLNGTVGYALAFLALATATGDARYEAAMHAQLKRAAESGDDAPGLVTGVSGLRAVAQLATAIEPRYDRFVARCDAFVEASLPAGPVRPTWVGAYDVISGWSGMRLARAVGGACEADRTTALLEWLLEDAARWAAPGEPGGRAAHWLGMAHGLAGVVATLAVTLPGIAPELHARLLRAAGYLAACVRVQDDRRAWPRAAEDEAGVRCRSVWCVGAAGIGSALLALGQRLADGEIAAFARGVLTEVSGAPSSALGFGGQGICHGTAGNALVYFAAARRTGDAVFARACERLVLETIAGFEASSGTCLAVGVDGITYDALGELNGVAGVAIALLTMCSEFDDRWLRLHALA